MSFDAGIVVVGGGLAGLSAAISAARQGEQVVVLERGSFSGAKNVSGGRMYTHALTKLLPDALERAPLELPIERETYLVRCGGRELSLSFSSTRRDSYSVLRSKFDRWLASEAESLGVTISYNTVVTGARYDGDGVLLETSIGDMKAAVVVEADGVTAPLSRYLLGRTLSPDTFMLGVKEVVSSGTHERGEAKTILGLTKGLKGGGFLYTNRDTLSLGFTLKVDSLQGAKVKSSELIEEFRESLGVGGEVLEYSAHMIPYFGYSKLPPLTMRNVIVAGDAGGFLLSNGFTIRGMDMAIESGRIAGETAVRVFRSGDYRHTESYERALGDSFVLSDLRASERAFKALNNPRVYDTYPEALCGALEKAFSIDGVKIGRPLQIFTEELKERGATLGELVRFLWEIA